MILKRLVRDSTLGRIIYKTTQHSFFSYPEEDPNYSVPEKYLPTSCSSSNSTIANNHDAICNDDEKLDHSPVTYKYIATWDSDNDAENPYNWTVSEKAVVCILIGFNTICQYLAASIFTPIAADLKKEFGVTTVQSSLPLSLFVVGYGIGPMISSPLTEISKIGRSSIYTINLLMSFILSFPLAFANNFAVICVFRFLTGLFCAATALGGASYNDILLNHAYIGQGIWGAASWFSIAVGPVIGSVITVRCGWQWVFKFLLILNGASFLIIGFLLPETSQRTLLSRKAERLRVRTGNKEITSHGDIEYKSIHINQFLFETLIRPFEVSIVEPVCILINVYITLIYAVVYLWFEAFPIVFIQMRGWSTVLMGAAFLPIFIGSLISTAYFLVVLDYHLKKRRKRDGVIYPEVYIHPSIAFVGAMFMPLGIFLFGWTSKASIHWFPSMLGAACFGFSAYMGFQTLMSYLSHSFKRYVASVMAANNFFRSLIGGLICLSAHPLYNNLSANSPNYPVGWGSTILGFIAILLSLIPLIFYFNGPKLRARSKFAN